jgi:hypothetical protein
MGEWAEHIDICLEVFLLKGIFKISKKKTTFNTAYESHLHNRTFIL